MPNKPADPTKANALLQKLMRTRPLPVVPDPAPAQLSMPTEKGGVVAPDHLAGLIGNVSNLLELTGGQRELVGASLRTVSSAIQRVAPEHWVELQELIAAFVADPQDKDVKARLGALLRDAPRPDH